MKYPNFCLYFSVIIRFFKIKKIMFELIFEDILG